MSWRRREESRPDSALCSRASSSVLPRCCPGRRQAVVLCSASGEASNSRLCSAVSIGGNAWGR